MNRNQPPPQAQRRSRAAPEYGDTGQYGYIAQNRRDAGQSGSRRGTDIKSQRGEHSYKSTGTKQDGNRSGTQNRSGAYGQRGAQNRRSADNRSASRARNASASRQNTRRTRKRKPTPEELEYQRRVEAKLKQRTKKRRREFIQLWTARFILFLITFAVFFVLAVALFFVNLLYNPGKPHPPTVTYQTGAKKEDPDYSNRKLDYESVIIDGVPYINISELAELYSFTITGDKFILKYIIEPAVDNDPGVNIRFVVGSSEAEINGERVRLNNIAFTVGEELFVPIEVFDKYFIGIEAAYDSVKNTLIIQRERINDEKGILLSYVDIGFRILPNLFPDNIGEDELDNETLLATDPNRVIFTEDILNSVSGR